MPSPAADDPTSHASKSDTGPHFAMRCMPCGAMAAVPISASQIETDFAEILRSLPGGDLTEILAFAERHAGHGAEPCVVDIQPVEKPRDA